MNVRDPAPFSVSLSAEQMNALMGHVADLLAQGTDAGISTDFITVDQAAAVLGLSRKTIANYLSAGTLTRHGGRRRPLVSRAEVESLARGRLRSQKKATRPIRSRRTNGGTFRSRARK